MAPSKQLLSFLRASLRSDCVLNRSTQHLCASAARWQSTWSGYPRRSNVLSRTRVPATTPPPSPFRGTQCRTYKTVEEAKSRQRTGPLSLTAVVLFIGSGVGMYFYFQYEKERMERVRIAEHSKGVGKPKVGGPFELVDQDNQRFSSEARMKGRYSLVYFGFSHCPDICPEELDKMSAMLSLVEDRLPRSNPRNPDLLPIFITCDPARDTPAVLKSYLKEFDERMIGLTGTWEQIKAVCRAYRVYFSTPPGVKPGMDYLVDHSIYFYLMDPDGDFVEAIGRQHTAEQAADLITGHMRDWKGPIVKD